jgi:hypothetical protein
MAGEASGPVALTIVLPEGDEGSLNNEVAEINDYDFCW